MARPCQRPGTSSGLWHRGGDPVWVRGYSLVELMFVIATTFVMAGLAIPWVGADLDERRVRGAARYLAARVQRARAEAVARGASVALRFGPPASPLPFATFADGNGNGVLSADIRAGVDRPIAGVADLAGFAGVTVGVVPGTLSADGTPLGSDPVRFGSSRMASFTPLGTATPGSLYIRGRQGQQYVVRVYGDTGKSSVLRFDRRRAEWVPL